MRRAMHASQTCGAAALAALDGACAAVAALAHPLPHARLNLNSNSHPSATVRGASAPPAASLERRGTRSDRDEGYAAARPVANSVIEQYQGRAATVGLTQESLDAHTRLAAGEPARQSPVDRGADRQGTRSRRHASQVPHDAALSLHRRSGHAAEDGASLPSITGHALREHMDRNDVDFPPHVRHDDEYSVGRSAAGPEQQGWGGHEAASVAERSTPSMGGWARETPVVGREQKRCDVHEARASALSKVQLAYSRELSKLTGRR